MGLGKSSKLLDADPRDRPTDHETLDLRGPFEDRVGPIGATVSTGHGTFRKEMDPQMSAIDSVGTKLSRIPDPINWVSQEHRCKA